MEWLEHTSYREVLKKIAEPPPAGLGLTIHFNSLRKFYLKNLPFYLQIQRHNEARDWRALEKQAADDPVHLHDLIRESLERQVMAGLQNGEINSGKTFQLIDYLLRWRAQEVNLRKQGVPVGLPSRPALIRPPLAPPKEPLEIKPPAPDFLNNLEQP
jgi:hypothetical protein